MEQSQLALIIFSNTVLCNENTVYCDTVQGGMDLSRTRLKTNSILAEHD